VVLWGGPRIGSFLGPLWGRVSSECNSGLLTSVISNLGVFLNVYDLGDKIRAPPILHHKWLISNTPNLPKRNLELINEIKL